MHQLYTYKLAQWCFVLFDNHYYRHQCCIQLRKQRLDWGFNIEAAYHFSTGNDVNINWSHLDANSNFIPSGVLLYNLNNEWDAVNGELGQVVDFSAIQKYVSMVVSSGHA